MSVEKIKEQVASTKEMLANGFTFYISLDDECDFDVCEAESDIWNEMHGVGLSKIQSYSDELFFGSRSYWLWFENEADFKKSVADSGVDLSVLEKGDCPPEVGFNTVPFPIHLVES